MMNYEVVKEPVMELLEAATRRMQQEKTPATQVAEKDLLVWSNLCKFMGFMSKANAFIYNKSQQYREAAACSDDLRDVNILIQDLEILCKEFLADLERLRDPFSSVLQNSRRTVKDIRDQVLSYDDTLAALDDDLEELLKKEQQQQWEKDEILEDAEEPHQRDDIQEEEAVPPQRDVIYDEQHPKRDVMEKEAEREQEQKPSPFAEETLPPTDESERLTSPFSLSLLAGQLSMSSLSMSTSLTDGTGTDSGFGEDDMARCLQRGADGRRLELKTECDDQRGDFSSPELARTIE